jgi:hypothetical protein
MAGAGSGRGAGGRRMGEVKVGRGFAKLYGDEPSPSGSIAVNTTDRRIRRFLLLAGCAGVLSLLGGCGLAGPLHTQEVTINAPQTGAGGIDVAAHNGSVTITRVQGSQVTIVATLKMQTEERLGAMQVTATRDADQTLVIRADPPQGWKNREGVSFDITIPEASGVKASSGNGRITISGLSGPADLGTSNGAIHLRGHDGPVKARTSNGAIEGEGISGPVEARTSNGAIEIALTDSNAGPAKLRTSNGAVRLEVGPAFAGDLEVDTSNGSINVPDGGAGVELKSLRRGSASLRFGSGGSASEIDTSNGSVRVRRRG